MNEKKKLCKFKETCPQWLSKKDCGFQHVLCKFNQTCRDKQKCMFYHKQKQVFDKPKSQTLCKFNTTCSKPGCPFKHQKAPQGSQSQGNNPIQVNRPFAVGQKSKAICRFGQKCRNTDCRFDHPQRQGRDKPNIMNQFQNRQEIQPNRQLSQPQYQNKFQGSFQNESRRAQNKFCLNFLLTNNCQNGQSCQKLHEFTQKSSIKRVFYSTQIPQGEFNISFYQHTKENDSQSKELIYVLQQRQMISFRKLISAQNLYKDFGGIGPNRENKTYLRSISDQMFRANSGINGIEAFVYNGNQFLTFISGSIISIYNVTRGEVDYFQTSRMGNKLTGCVLISLVGLLLISTSQSGIKKFQFNQSRQKFEQRQFNDVQFGMRKLKSTQSQILGDNIIYGITSQNAILLMNTELRHNILSIPNVESLNDIDITLINNKIPVALVSCSVNSRQHQVLAVNLLNFQKQPLLQYDFISGIGKICVIENHLLVQVKNKGFVIYKINEFQKEIGILPLLNQASQVRKDNKGNLLILESGSIQSQGSISIFKIKRV